jgi:hypothetical protein
MRFLTATVGLVVVNTALAAADEYAVWSAIDSGKPGKVEWKKSDRTFPSEDEAYAEAAKISKGDAVREVRVLKADRPAPKADSPILAGRVAEAPAVPGVQKAQKFTFNKDGTMKFESGGNAYTYRYTIDGDELWIVWEFAGRLSDQVYKLTKDGFHIVKAKERTATEWFEFKDLQPNNIYQYVK